MKTPWKRKSKYSFISVDKQGKLACAVLDCKSNDIDKNYSYSIWGCQWPICKEHAKFYKNLGKMRKENNEEGMKALLSDVTKPFLGHGKIKRRKLKEVK